MSEKEKPSRTSDEARGDERDSDKMPSSLDRLADFTRKILRVSKDELRLARKAPRDVRRR